MLHESAVWDPVDRGIIFDLEKDEVFFLKGGERLPKHLYKTVFLEMYII